MDDEKWLLPKDEITETIEHKWIDLVSPHLNGLNYIEIVEKVKELPSPYDMLLKAQIAHLRSSGWLSKEEIIKWLGNYDCSQFRGYVGVSDSMAKYIAIEAISKLMEDIPTLKE